MPTGDKVLHYKILQKLGQGGMGIVYKAEDTRLKRYVAIKFLPHQISLNVEARQRFLIEAQAAAALNHPNITQIYAIEEDKDNIFISMEYVEGVELKELLRQKQTESFNIKEVLNHSCQIAEGITAAHENGIVHRDIKPANIMITPAGKVKIMDFGLAKMPGMEDITRIGTTMGTTAYMSPEQARGEEVNHLTDIWSFGVVLYEMLTGHLPFPGRYEQAIIYGILNDSPESVNKKRSDIPVVLVSLIENLLEKDPSKRNSKMKDVMSELRIISSAIEGKEKIVSSIEKNLPSIAVIPFVNMSADKEQEYFCDGITEEIINALTQVQNLRVVARSSAFAFKGQNKDIREIGKILNVDHVMEGSVRKAANKIRITAQLIKVSDGFHLWSEKYDRSLDDIFEIQDEISINIVDYLKVTLLAGERASVGKYKTGNIEAYNHYLKGWHYLEMYTAEGIEKSLYHFGRAVALDALYAPGYCGMAQVMFNSALFGNIPAKEGFESSRFYTQKALELDKSLGESYSILGYINATYDWDWKSAEQNFRKALTFSPNNAEIHVLYSLYLRLMNKYDEAIRSMQYAMSLNPLSPSYQAWYGQTLVYAGKFDEAIEELNKSIDMFPNFWVLYFELSGAYLSKGMYKEALETSEKANLLSGGVVMARASEIVNNFIIGNTAKADKQLEELINISETAYISPSDFFNIYLAKGDFEKAFEWLFKAFEDHDSALLYYMNYPPVYNALKDDPTFKDILQKIMPS
jgi:serine/threonine protein kinase/Flp pilus assembly protein TadD